MITIMTGRTNLVNGKINRKINDLHQAHLELKQRIHQREAEVRSLLADLLTPSAAKTFPAVSAPAARSRETKDACTSPVHPCEVQPLQTRPTAKPTTEVRVLNAASPVPVLRIKGRLPMSVTEPTAATRCAPQSMPADDGSFLLGATDSIALLLTMEQRHLRRPMIQPRSAAGPPEASDSLALSPIGVIAPREDISDASVTATLETPSQRAAVSFHAEACEVAGATGAYADAAPPLLPHAKRVRFSSRSPQVELFSVERPESTMSAALTSLVATTGNTSERLLHAAGSPAPLRVSTLSSLRATSLATHPTAAQLSETHGRLSTSPEMIRSSMKEMLSVIAEAKQSLSGSSGDWSRGTEESSSAFSRDTCKSGGQHRREQRRPPATLLPVHECERYVVLKRSVSGGSNVGAGAREEDGDNATEAATPSPPRKRRNSVSTTDSPASMSKGTSTYRVSTGCGIKIPKTANTALGDVNPTESAPSISPNPPDALGNTAGKESADSEACFTQSVIAALPIFLQRGRSRAPPFSNVDNSSTASHTPHPSRVDQSVAVNLSNVTVHEAVSILGRLMDPGHPRRLLRRRGAPESEGSSSCNKAGRQQINREPVKLRTRVRPPNHPRRSRRKRTDAVTAIAADNATFASAPRAAGCDDAASAAAISLACGPTLYFS